MSEHSHETLSGGRFESPSHQSGPPTEIDCSDWEPDIPAEQWSSGRLVRVCQSLPLVTSEFSPAAETRLEIAVQLAPEAAAEHVFLFATRMIAAIHDADPGLRLAYDAVRSRAAPGEVVIALTPEDSGATGQRLEAITDAIRNVVAEFPQSKLNGVRLNPAA